MIVNLSGWIVLPEDYQEDDVGVATGRMFTDTPPNKDDVHKGECVLTAYSTKRERYLSCSLFHNRRTKHVLLS